MPHEEEISLVLLRTVFSAFDTKLPDTFVLSEYIKVNKGCEFGIELPSQTPQDGPEDTVLLCKAHPPPSCFLSSSHGFDSVTLRVSCCHKVIVSCALIPHSL